MSADPKHVVAVALTILSKNRSPSWISEKLGLKCSSPIEKGSPAPGEDLQARWPVHSYIYSLLPKQVVDRTKASEALHRLLDELLTTVEDVSIQFFEVKNESICMSIQCLYQSPENLCLVLKPDILSRIAALDVDFSISNLRTGLQE